MSQGINERLLQWKGMEATEDLSKSSPAKVVIIGAGKGGLPMILNAGQQRRRCCGRVILAR